MKIIAIGTSNFLISCIKGLIKSGHEIICLISEPENMLPVNSINIKKISLEFNIDYYETNDINSKDSLEYIASLKPDLIFSAWPRIIRKNILELPKFGVIGSHPTALPFNRGRHPLHWQLVLKIKKSMLSFFIMDEGVDSGPILLQIPYEINSNDNIKTISEKMGRLAVESAEKLGEILNADNILRNSVIQNKSLANTWRKRTLFDVTIDFRMNGDDILSLVKSFCDPFSGAMICHKNSVSIVMDAKKTQKEILPNFIENIEPGKVLLIEKNLLRIKAADCILDLTIQENKDLIDEPPKYVYPPQKYLFDNPELKKFYN